MSSKNPVRSCEDVDEVALSFAEIKALCAGDPRIKERMDLDVDVARLKIMKADYKTKQYRLEDSLIHTFPAEIAKTNEQIESLKADMQTLSEHPHPDGGFAGMTVLTDNLLERENAGAALIEATKQATGLDPVEIGSYRGFAMSVTLENFGKKFVLTMQGKLRYQAELGSDPKGNLIRLDNALAQMPQRMQSLQTHLEETYHQQEAAKAELEKYTLVYEKSGEDYNSEVEAGNVFEQNPVYSDNYKVKEKSTVSVKISKGTEQTTAPKVAGMTYEEAVDALEKNKLKAEKIEETSKTIKEGIVISQETDANTTANAGDTVKIHVSIGTGVNQVVMPNVLGKTEADAKSALEAKNLVVKTEYKENTDKENGEVLEQSIKSGENIDEGTEVTITVNKLAEMKEATITINVKSLTGGYEVPDKENTNTTNTTGSSSSTTVKEKKLTVKVGEDKVYDKKVDLNSTNIQTKISGKGTVTVKVYVDDILKSQKDINLNTTSSYTFE